jgi:hypothetical protein
LPQKDLITDMVQLYEVNKGRDVLPAVDADVQELQEITRRITAIYINLMERVKTREELLKKGWEARLAEKEAEVDWNYGTL